MPSRTDLGWSNFFEEQFQRLARSRLVPARVAEENRGLYRVLSESGECWAGVRGLFHQAAASREEFPAVGDWVLIEHHPPRATIHHLLERRTKFARKTAGDKTEQQIVAANIDTVFVVTSLNRDFNPRRLERYLALAWESGARPVALLNKADLCDDPAEYLQAAREVAGGAEILPCSAWTGNGLCELRERVRVGGTCALLGSSGVGKSSLINALLGEGLQAVGPVRDTDDRGRHTTTSRQLIVAPGGGVLIDTPGMRELQLWDAAEGLGAVFADVEELARSCKFRDCRHESEPGCAVMGAVAEERLESYRKLGREQLFLEAKQDAAVRAQQKKAIRNVMKEQKRYYRER